MRIMALSADAVEVIRHQRESFWRKFGRLPRPGDPLLFDPDSRTPVPLPPRLSPDQIRSVFARAGIRPEHAYAYAKSGVLLTPAWDAAITEYRTLGPDAWRGLLGDA